MTISAVSTATAQTIWDEIQQAAMRKKQETVSASNGQQVGVVAIDLADFDRDATALSAIREKAETTKQQASATADASETAATPEVKTALADVGPNSFERIIKTADKAYQNLSARDTPAASRSIKTSA